jgi:3alpha(or 20beta)-hydroxysteroid dehydrogenase
MRFDGKVVLITGAARGMGASHVRGFVAEGARVVATDVRDAEGRELAADFPGSVRYEHLDVRIKEEWERVVAVAEETFGPIDVLVNNAGIMPLAGLLDATVEQFEIAFGVNVIGTFLGMQTVAAGMVARGRGAIVNISSIAGLVGMGGGVAYNASKWASRGLTKCAALDVAHSGVRINSVHPGYTLTPMVEGLSGGMVDLQAIPRGAQPQEVTNVVLFAASDEASYCTGVEFVVDGGFSAGIAATLNPASDR